MKLFITLILTLYSLILFSQKKETLYILDNKRIINSDEHRQLHYLFSIKSKNKKFNNDAYLFTIPNQVSFDNFKDIEDLEKEVKLDTIQNVVDLRKLGKKKPCDLHDFLSLKNIFLVYKKRSMSRMVCLPLIYEGTQKNAEMMKF